MIKNSRLSEHTEASLRLVVRPLCERAVLIHEGALSFVLPRFASTTIPRYFLQQAMTCRLSAKDTWELAPNTEPDAALKKSPRLRQSRETLLL